MQKHDLILVDMSDVDVVLKCTGKANDPKFASAGLRAGAKRVLISSPSEHADVMVVSGANDHVLQGQRIISNASCTTNALAAFLRVLDDGFGVLAGHMKTIHCYTGSQPTIDAARGATLERNCAVRVPTASVSAVDLTCRLTRQIDVASLIRYLQRACPGILGLTDRPLVSSDLKVRPKSLVIAAPQVQVTGQKVVRIFGWYDNEWSFSARMFDVAQ